MSKKRDLSDFIEDIIVSISDIEAFTKGMSFDALRRIKKPFTR